jgi:putative ABC transport system ATP-binding protein
MTGKDTNENESKNTESSDSTGKEAVKVTHKATDRVSHKDTGKAKKSSDSSDKTTGKNTDKTTESKTGTKTDTTTASSADSSTGSSSGDTLIKVRNLVKVYGKGKGSFKALRGLNLDIKKGESVAIVGKSGSGKSTLMHLLALLDTPTGGTIEINGKSTTTISQRNLNKIRNNEFGFIFQQFFMNANDSVLSNVKLPLSIANTNPLKRTGLAMEALEAVGLTEKAKNKANDLSGGQKQRVCIARAIVNNPNVIFADEPTGNLDSQTADMVQRLMFNLHKTRGITLIIVTHDEDLANLCDRQIAIKDGEIIAQTSKNEDTPTTIFDHLELAHSGDTVKDLDVIPAEKSDVIPAEAGIQPAEETSDVIPALDNGELARPGIQPEAADPVKPEETPVEPESQPEETPAVETEPESVFDSLDATENTDSAPEETAVETSSVEPEPAEAVKPEETPAPDVIPAEAGIQPEPEETPAPVEAVAPTETPVETPASDVILAQEIVEPAVEAPAEPEPQPVENPVQETQPQPVETPAVETEPAEAVAPIEIPAETPAPTETPVQETQPQPEQTPIETPIEAAEEVDLFADFYEETPVVEAAAPVAPEETATPQPVVPQEETPTPQTVVPEQTQPQLEETPAEPKPNPVETVQPNSEETPAPQPIVPEQTTEQTQPQLEETPAEPEPVPEEQTPVETPAEPEPASPYPSPVAPVKPAVQESSGPTKYPTPVAPSPNITSTDTDK